MTPTFFGATIADMDLTKLGLSVQDVMESLQRVDPALWGMAAGGAIGGLGTAAVTEEEDPNRAAKILLGLGIGAAGGGAAGRHFGPALGLGKQPAAGPSVVRRAEAPPAPAGQVVRSPVTESTALPASIRARSVSGPASEARLRQTEQQMRQQAIQQMDQAVTQSAAARERAALLKDQGRVQARMQAFMAPGAPAGAAQPGRPRNFILGPGVQRVRGADRYAARTSMPKMAGVTEDVLSGLKENPWIPGAVAGGGIGAGLGWATSDPGTRKRKMLMGMLLGAPAGALSAETVNAIIKAMGGVESASMEAQGTFREAGAGLREGAARGMENLITSQGPDAVREAIQLAKGASLEAIVHDLAKISAFEEFISQNPWIPGAAAGAAVGAGVGGMAKKKRGAKALLGAGIGGLAGGLAGHGIGEYVKSRGKAAPASPPPPPQAENAIARGIRTARSAVQGGTAIRPSIEAAVQAGTPDAWATAAGEVARQTGLPPDLSMQIARRMGEELGTPDTQAIGATASSLASLFGVDPAALQGMDL